MMQTSLQRALLPARQRVCAPVCAKGKGKQASVKVNKRGKVSSRPGPGWQPTEAATPQPVQQQQPATQQQQQQPAATTAAAASSPPATAAAAPTAAPQQAAAQQQQVQTPPRVASQPQVSETPQVVVDRMFKRVLVCAGLPVLTGMLLFPAFWYLRVVAKVEYPIWVVYVTQALMIGGGLLGISYGILSTSWDPRREGSALGWTELQANLPILLNRNKDQQGQ